MAFAVLGTSLVASSFVLEPPVQSRDAMRIIEKIEVPKPIENTFSANDLCSEFTNKVSPESVEILEHFGPEAPALLNKYAIALEDALIKVVNENVRLRKGGD